MISKKVRPLLSEAQVEVIERVEGSPRAGVFVGIEYDVEADFTTAILELKCGVRAEVTPEGEWVLPQLGMSVVQALKLTAGMSSMVEVA